MDRPTADGAIRLNRFLARAGLGSRRGVEDLVRAGRVTVNGVAIAGLETRVDPARDTVALDGKEIRLPAAWGVWAFHKPAGVVSTLRAQAGQQGLAPFRTRAGLPPGAVPVGRLDADSTGLLLWSDDGQLAQGLLKPAHGVWKHYEVELDAPLTDAGVRAVVAGGLTLDGRPCLPARLAPLPGPRARRWQVGLREGRNRQVRRMFALLGLTVLRLHRTAVGPIRLGRLAPGAFRRLTPREETALRRAAAGPGAANS
mgnify:CR=1 FL=1